jgi:hypothetical protein
VTTLAAEAFALPVRALDRARLWYFRLLGPLAKPLVRSRELRIAVFGTVSLCVALALTSTVPLFLLAVGPLVMGVPHVASDLRYLIFRHGIHRRWWLVIPAIGLYAAHTVTFDARYAIGVVMFAALVARGKNHLRRALALGLAGAWMTLATLDGHQTALVFAHLHNFFALGFLWAWRPHRASKQHWLPIATFVAGAALILGGAIDGVVEHFHGFEGTVGRTGIAWNLALYAPGVPWPWGARLVLLFAFAQSAHYSVWLRLVPEDDRPRETPRTWAATFAALRADMGLVVGTALFLLTVGLAVWAVIDLYEARMGYLRLVLFHGYLEMAAIALLFVEGRPLRSADALEGTIANTGDSAPTAA